MYATHLSIEGMISDGVPEVERSKFKSLEELQQTINSIKVKEKVLLKTQLMCNAM